jgi:hypothetical protein
MRLQDVYSHIYKRFPKECDALGMMGQQRREKRWKNEVRQGIKLAERRGLIVHVGDGNTEEYERL